MKTFKSFSLIATLLVLGCAAPNAIISEYDETIDFNYYDTFVLCVEDFNINNTKHPELDNTYVRELIGLEVENNMEVLGYKTNVLQPQLQAGFKIAITEEEVMVRNCEVQEKLGYWETCTINNVIYTRETLIVYVSDINKNQVIWQATIPCELNKSKKRLQHYIKPLIEELFLEFPEVQK
ncbi:DUF4136 domain-containing protein [Lacinutrix iliipiscaria]|uniref:DUF4136 domain-containing protein n=1 Tax=Lacinutrix iliipiscaria TaxID=1230532 RepID=A0ABW5WTV7_9FLAO